MTESGEVQHQWVVESIAGVPTVEPRPMISLGPDDQLTGSTGVNRIKGTYEAHDESIRISAGGMTRMAGPPEAMEQERRFLAALEGVHGFHIGEGRLELGTVGEGMVMVRTASTGSAPG
jgi:heat shock protein HslJ